VTLLAAVAALASLRLPPVKLNEEGNVVPAEEEAEEEVEGAAEPMTTDEATQPRCAPHMLRGATVLEQMGQTYGSNSILYPTIPRKRCIWYI
jgi:hypothetical protein